MKLSFVFVATFLMTQNAWSDLKKHYFDFAFDQAIQVEKVYEVTQVPPDKLVQYIESQGVRIATFRDSFTGATQPALANAAKASRELIQAAQLPPQTSGRLLPVRNGFEQDTILIREDSHTHILLHEYMHYLLFFKGTQPQGNLDETFARAEKKQLFYQRKLFENPIFLLNPLWRKDILEAQHELIKLIYQRIQIGQAQEAIVEKLLARYIDKNNPHYNELRQKNGHTYAENMINNAITVFNNLHFAVDWNRNTTNELYLGLKNKDVEVMDPNKEHLTDEEAKAFAETSEFHMIELQKTKDEILKLKKFFLEF